MKIKSILFLLLFPAFQTGYAASLEKAMQRKLIVVTENCISDIYLLGIPDNESFFREVFSKVWIFHKDIMFVSCDSLNKIISTSNPKEYSVIKLSLSLEKKPGDIEWKDNLLLGLFLGEEFTKHPEVTNNKQPIAAYRFTQDRIYADELAFSVKFLSDFLQCELNKNNCDYEEEAEANKAKLKNKILVIEDEVLFEDAKTEISKNIFPCQVLILNKSDFWKTLSADQDKYAFLSIAAHKFGKMSTRYYIVNMSDFKILGYDTPGGMEILGRRYVEKKRIKKIAGIYAD